MFRLSFCACAHSHIPYLWYCKIFFVLPSFFCLYEGTRTQRSKYPTNPTNPWAVTVRGLGPACCHILHHEQVSLQWVSAAACYRAYLPSPNNRMVWCIPLWHGLPTRQGAASVKCACLLVLLVKTVSPGRHVSQPSPTPSSPVAWGSQFPMHDH